MVQLSVSVHINSFLVIVGFGICVITQIFFKLYAFIRQIVVIKEEWFILETWTRRWEEEGTVGIPLSHPAEVKHVRESWSEND